MKKQIQEFLFQWFMRRNIKNHKASHAREIEEMCKTAGITLSPQEGEDKFLKKWEPLMQDVNVDSYRFYSQFLGHDPNILPDDLFHAIIDPMINDKTSLPVYLNKNMYEKVIGNVFPTCVLRKMDGNYMTPDYKDLEMTNQLFQSMVIENQHLKDLGRIIIKPTVETGRGKGVRLFCYENGVWRSNDNKELSLDFLNKEYGANLIIQECIEPSDFVRQFNPTSYSTLRIYTYKSVKDGDIHFLGGYMRVGDVGSFKDNIGNGGFAIPIMEDGSLAHFASNGTRNKFDVVNGVDLKNTMFKVPNFDKVLKTAFYGAEMNPLNRVVSWDIILDKENEPHIIEFNLRCQTITTMQTTYKTFFGKYTDEIIDYCKERIKEKRYFTYSIYLKGEKE